jgi:hypothetical protein
MASKYKNKLCEFDNGSEVLSFHSQAERARYIELLNMQKRGEIANLRCQPKFELIERFHRNGKNYAAEFYVADFEYWQDYSVVVEDTKGVSTTAYKGKRKHFLKLNPNVVFRESRLINGKFHIIDL